MKRRSFLQALLAYPALGATEWNYGDRGPEKWGGLDPAYALCRDGKGQSPIDLRDGLREQTRPLKIDWKPGKFTIVNNGHTIQLNAPAGSSIELAGVRSELVQFHFHAPSEHAISEKRAAMEAHFVHRDADGHLTVVAVLLKPGGTNRVFAAAMNAAPAKPEMPGTEVQTEVTLDPRGLLPATTAKTWRYTGSLTTPPCSEGVAWIVFDQMVTVDRAGIDRFHVIAPANARPLQPLNSRKLDRYR